jgi:hypothetical protein
MSPANVRVNEYREIKPDGEFPVTISNHDGVFYMWVLSVYFSFIILFYIPIIRFICY